MEEKSKADEKQDERRNGSKPDNPKLDLTDYIALTIAMLQTTLLPVVLIFLAIILLFASLEIAVNYGSIWLIALWGPYVAIVVAIRRFMNWRRLQKIRKEYR